MDTKRLLSGTPGACALLVVGALAGMTAAAYMDSSAGRETHADGSAVQAPRPSGLEAGDPQHQPGSTLAELRNGRRGRPELAHDEPVARPVKTYDRQIGTYTRTWPDGRVEFQVNTEYLLPQEAPGTWISEEDYDARARAYAARILRQVDEMNRKTIDTILAPPCNYSYNGCR